MYLTEITYNGSDVLIMWVVGVWRHIVDLWCVCTLHWPENYCSSLSDATYTHTTVPEYVSKHCPRT
jgi:hypothetical protein